MSGGRYSRVFSHVAALLAVALLAFAGVRSTVMRAAEAAPGLPTCQTAAAMPGMDHGIAPEKGGAAHRACDFCDAAAVAPLQAVAAPLPLPHAVAWRPAPLAGGLGARGPPAFAPRARGPPALLNA